MAFVVIFYIVFVNACIKICLKIKQKYVINEWTKNLSTEMKIIKNLMGILELQSTITEMKNSLDVFNSRLEMAVEWTWRHSNIVVL